MKNSILILLLVGFLSGVGFSDDELVAWWGFDEGGDGVTLEKISGKSDKLMGNFVYEDGVAGKCLRFDGLTSYVLREAKNRPRFSNAMTIEAWVAPQVYPWNWTAILSQEKEHGSGYFFGMDAEGHIGFGVSLVTDYQWHMCASDSRVDLLKWNHIAATVDQQNGIKLYINGEVAGGCKIHTGSWYRKNWFKHGDDVDVYIGRSHTKMSPKYSERTPSRETMSNMIFDGLIDEVKIYKRSLSGEEIREKFESSKPAKMDRLNFRRLPSGPSGAGEFGGYYTRLRYADEWEKLWRVGDHSDILVRFDEYPVKAVFWRGTNYGLSWVTENDLWMGDQSVEANYNTGCNEHMSDKRCVFSSVKLVENNDARVVVHWRYAVTGIDYSIVNTDETGWGDWVDEYYYIYPDAVATRYWVYWTSMFGKPRHLQFQETIFLNQPGDRPEDTVELEALTLANMDGDSFTYSWADEPPGRYDKPDNALIQVTNMRSKYRPFIIFELGGRIKRFGGHCPLSHFRWWNHWPVGQIANDGRVATGADRPSHSSLTSGEVVYHDGEGLSHKAVVLTGMTERPAGELAKLARSWNYAPQVVLKSKGFKSEGFDKFQRAYVIDKNGNASDLKFAIAASEKSPLVNPCFVVKNWGRGRADMKMNGKNLTPGKNLRFGRYERLEGTDLIVWIKMTAESDTKFEIESAR